MSRAPALDRLYGLQVVRAVAAILVICVHVLQAINNANLSVWQDPGERWDGFGAVGVDLFFVLSGLVVSLSAARRPEPKTFLLRRLIRILPFYWVAAVFFLILRFAFFQPLTKVQVAYMPFLLPNPTKPLNFTPYPNSWTLVFELFFYICLYLGLVANRGRARSICVAIVLATVLLHIATFYVFHRNIAVLNYYGCPIVLEFLFGVAIGVVLERRPLSKGVAIGTLALGCAALLLGIVAGSGDIWSPAPLLVSPEAGLMRVLQWGIPAALVVLGTAGLSWTPRSHGGHLAVYLGDACYSIYLMQWLPLALLEAGLEPGGILRTNGYVTAILTVVLAVVWGVLVYRFVEKPLTAYLTKRFTGRPKPKEPLADAGIAPASLKPDPKL